MRLKGRELGCEDRTVVAQLCDAQLDDRGFGSCSVARTSGSARLGSHLSRMRLDLVLSDVERRGMVGEVRRQRAGLGGEAAAPDGPVGGGADHLPVAEAGVEETLKEVGDRGRPRRSRTRSSATRLRDDACCDGVPQVLADQGGLGIIGAVDPRRPVGPSLTGDVAGSDVIDVEELVDLLLLPTPLARGTSRSQDRADGRVRPAARVTVGWRAPVLRGNRLQPVLRSRVGSSGCVERASVHDHLGRQSLGATTG